MSPHQESCQSCSDTAGPEVSGVAPLEVVVLRCSGGERAPRRQMRRGNQKGADETHPVRSQRGEDSRRRSYNVKAGGGGKRYAILYLRGNEKSASCLQSRCQASNKPSGAAPPGAGRDHQPTSSKTPQFRHSPSCCCGYEWVR